jgi:hypothetical protein
MKVWGHKAERKAIALAEIAGPAEVNTYTSRKADPALIRSIREQGQQQPLILTRDLKILDGVRRWQAAAKAGLTRLEADVILEDLSRDDQFRIVNSIENRQNRSADEIVAEIIAHVGADEILRPSGRGKHGGKGGQLIARIRYLYPNLATSTVFKYAQAAVRIVAASHIERGQIVVELKDQREYNYVARRLEALSEISRKRQAIESRYSKVRDELAELKRMEQAVEAELLKAVPKSAKIKGRATKLAALRKAAERWAKEKRA